MEADAQWEKFKFFLYIKLPKVTGLNPNKGNFWSFSKVHLLMED